MLYFYLSLINDGEDRSKFEILYYEYRERMYAAAFEILKNNEDAEDAVHNAFVGIANNIASIDEPKSSRALSYVIKAAKNAALNIYNKRNRITFVKLEDNLKISDEDFFNSLCIKQDYESVVKAITELRDIYKIPMYYYYLHEMKIKDIAVLMNIKPSAVSVRINRGIKELINMLGDENNDG